MSRSHLFEILLVGLGGFVGSILRFLVSGWTHRLAPFGAFPYGTVVVNVLGCLAIGLLAGLADMRGAMSPHQRVFLLIGVLGGFTTFSTFAYETFALAQDSETAKAAANTIVQVVLGLAAAWFGYSSIRYL